MVSPHAKERGMRKERKGLVISRSGDKTIVVVVETRRRHPKYEKVVRQSSKFHAHDEKNDARVGDLVRIVETRPLSRMKRWRLVEILTRGAAAGQSPDAVEADAADEQRS
jgi:small subunit ribosomal protein S17